MDDQLLFDKLAYVDRLIKAGIDEQQARALSDALAEALKESVATKADIVRLEQATKAEITRLEHKLDLLARDLKIWMGGVALALFSALTVVRFFVH